MTTIPEMCMQYTAVFQTLRIELAVAMGVGVAIGIAAAWLHRK